MAAVIVGLLTAICLFNSNAHLTEAKNKSRQRRKEMKGDGLKCVIPEVSHLVEMVW